MKWKTGIKNACETKPQAVKNFQPCSEQPSCTPTFYHRFISFCDTSVSFLLVLRRHSCIRSNVVFFEFSKKDIFQSELLSLFCVSLLLNSKTIVFVASVSFATLLSLKNSYSLQQRNSFLLFSSYTGLTFRVGNEIVIFSPFILSKTDFNVKY